MAALILDYCTNISFAMSIGCVIMLLLWSIRLSKGGFSQFWKMALLPSFGFMLMSFWNLNISFCALHLLYLVIFCYGVYLCIFLTIAICCNQIVCGILDREMEGALVFDRIYKMG